MSLYGCVQEKALTKWVCPSLSLDAVRRDLIRTTAQSAEKELCHKETAMNASCWNQQQHGSFRTPSDDDDRWSTAKDKDKEKEKENV